MCAATPQQSTIAATVLSMEESAWKKDAVGGAPTLCARVCGMGATRPDANEHHKSPVRCAGSLQLRELRRARQLRCRWRAEEVTQIKHRSDHEVKPADKGRKEAVWASPSFCGRVMADGMGSRGGLRIAAPTRPARPARVVTRPAPQQRAGRLFRTACGRSPPLPGARRLRPAAS